MRCTLEGLSVMSFVQYFVVIMYTHLPCEACPWGAVCDEFCAVFCCYYVHTFAL